MAVKSTVNAMEERLSVSMLRMKFGDTQQMKIDLIRHIMKTRMLPLLVIFICCVSPNFMRSFKPQ